MLNYTMRDLPGSGVVWSAAAVSAAVVVPGVALAAVLPLL